MRWLPLVRPDDQACPGFQFVGELFQPDVVGLGKFPGPWDEEMQAQNTRARQAAA